MRVRIWSGLVAKAPYVARPDSQTPVIVAELDPRESVGNYYDSGPDTLVSPRSIAPGELNNETGR